MLLWCYNTEYSTAIAMFFEKMLEVHWNIGIQKNSKTLL
jgi:hypothetical protein